MFIEPEEPGDPFKVSDAGPCLTTLTSGNKAQMFPVHEGGVLLCPCQAMLKGIASIEEIVLGRR